MAEKSQNSQTKTLLVIRLYGGARLRVVTLSPSPSRVTRKKNHQKKNDRAKSRVQEARTSPPQAFARPFFSLGSLLRHVRRTERERDYSWSKAELRS